MAYNGERNQYLIAYRYTPATGPLSDIRGKVAVANLDGVSVSPEIPICETASHQVDVHVAAGPDEYLVVWVDAPGVFIDNVFGRRIRGDGTPVGPASGFPIATTPSEFLHDEPAVAYGAGFGYLVSSTYSPSAGPPGADVYGRYVMPGQDSAMGNEFPIDDRLLLQQAPTVACAPSGDCLLVEEDDWPSGSEFEIRGRFLMPHRVYLPMILRNY